MGRDCLRTLAELLSLGVREALRAGALCAGAGLRILSEITGPGNKVSHDRAALGLFWAIEPPSRSGRIRCVT